MRSLSAVAVISLLAIAGCRTAPGVSDRGLQSSKPRDSHRQALHASSPLVTREYRGRPVRSDRQRGGSPIRLVSGLASAPLLVEGLRADRHEPAGDTQALTPVGSPGPPPAPPAEGAAADGPAEKALPEKLSLTLQAAIQTALERNPDLVTAREAESVSLAAYDVARTYPYNPQYQGQIIPTPRAKNGDAGSTDNQHVIVQTFELAGQQRHRTAAGEAALNQVRWGIQQAELLTTAGTERLFLTALYQRDVRDLERSVARLNAELDGVLGRRFQAGQATAADVAMARLQSRAAERRADLAETTYRAAVLALRRQLNLSPQTPLQLTGALSQWKWRPVVTTGLDESGPPKTPSAKRRREESLDPAAVTALATELAAVRPDVMATRAGLDFSETQWDLARASRVPNVQIGPFYQRDDAATSFWGFQAQMNIPVVNTGKPLVRQREAQYQQQQVALSKLQQKATLEIQTAIERYERARRLMVRARKDFVKPLPELLKPFEDQFKAGQFDLLRVFAARTSLIEARRTYLDMLNELAQAAAEVTAVTGLPPGKLIETSDVIPVPPEPTLPE